jgi:3-methyladenine DNA glycosylase AlkD
VTRAAIEPIADRLDAALRAAGTAARAAQERRYLKSELTHYGVDAAGLKAAVRAIVPRGSLDRDRLRAVVEALWSRPVYERRAAAALVLERDARLLLAADLPLLERLLREAKTWALVDAIAVHVVGSVVARHPAAAARLDRWAGDRDFWIRRAAMLALLGPLRDGGGDFARFGRYAEAMLGDREPFIRKAIGWILRDTSRKRPDLVFDWLLPRAARASGVTRREAVKHLSAAQRAAIAAAAPGPPARRARGAPAPAE